MRARLIADAVSTLPPLRKDNLTRTKDIKRPSHGLRAMDFFLLGPCRVTRYRGKQRRHFFLLPTISAGAKLRFLRGKRQVTFLRCERTWLLFDISVISVYLFICCEVTGC